MPECGSFFPDEAAVGHVTISDLDEDTVKQYLQNRFSKVLENKGFTGDKIKRLLLTMRLK